MKGSLTIIDKVTKLPVGGINSAGESLRLLRESYFDYKKIAESEKTKRIAITAWRDTKTLELKNQREILEQYLTLTFKERAKNIQGFFDVLDEGIKNGNDFLIEKSIVAILDVAKQSPLEGTRELISAMKDTSVREIEI